MDARLEKISEIKQLKGDEVAQVVQLLQAEGNNEISFTRLCFYIGEVFKKRASKKLS